MHPDEVGTREQLGSALTELRVRAGFSVREVADSADALQGTVAGWFAGQHAPTRASRDMFNRVLAVCGVPEAEYELWWSAVERTSRRGGRRKVRPEPPYRGFAPFGAEDGALYFGCDELVDRLVDLIVGQRAKVQAERAAAAPDSTEPDRTVPGVTWAEAAVPAAMIVGTSGVGKSSLARGGLLGRLGGEGPLKDWRGAVVLPGDDPVEALEEAFAGLGDGDGPALLVFDQMEELWTQNSEAVRDAVNERMIAELRSGRDLVAVGVLRADFYGSAADVPWIASILEHAQVVVPPMSVEQLREIIVRPAQVVDAEVDENLVDMLIAEISPATGRPDAGVLPLLSHALRATWDVSDGRRLTVSDYLDTGRIAGAVEKTAEQVYADLTDTERDAARRLLLAMVNVDEEAITRRTVSLTELGADAGHGTSKTRREVLERFAAARLVTVSPTHAYVTHEALLTAWPRLTDWIDADRERLLLLRRLRALSEPWEAHDRPDDLLPGRARLELFDPLGYGSLDSVSRAFLVAARNRVTAREAVEERRRRQLRRTALFAGVFGVVAVVAATAALIAGVNSVSQRERAENLRDEALSRQLAVQSQDLADREPFLAAQLAMIAYRTSPTSEASSTLVETMSHAIPERFSGDESPATMARSSDGTRLAVVHNTGQVRVLGLDGEGITGEGVEFRAGDPGGLFGGSAWIPRSRTLLVGGRGQLTEWDLGELDLTTGDTAGRDTAGAGPRAGIAYPGVRGDVVAVAVSPDGRFVVAATSQAGVQAWVRDPARPTPLGPIPMPPDVAGGGRAVAFSPDGTLLATSSVTRRVDLWRVVGDRLEAAGSIGLTAGADNQLAEGLTFTPDGRTLLTGLRSKTIDAYDVSDPAAPARTRQYQGFTSYVTAVAVSHDGGLIAGAGANNTVRIFRADAPGTADPNPDAAPEVVTEPERVLRSAVNVSGLSFVGDHLITVSGDGLLQDWPAEVSAHPLTSATVFQIPADAAGARLLAADTSTDGRITQWSRRGRVPVSAGPDLLPPPGTVFSGSVVAPGSGTIAVIGSVDGSVHVADYSDPALPRLTGAVKAQDSLNETVDYSENSKLAVTSATDTTRVTVMSIADPAAPVVTGSVDVGGGSWWVSLSPDGRTAAAATNTGAVVLIDLTDPAAPRVIGDAYAFTGASTAVRWDVEGRRLVATSEAKTVAVIDVEDPRSPRLVATMSGPAGQLYSAGFSPDGTHVVAGGANAEVWVWDLDGVDTPMVLRSYPGTVYDVRFVTDDLVLAAGEGGTVQSWSVDPDAVIAAHCARDGDQISDVDWHTYLPETEYRSPCG